MLRISMLRSAAALFAFSASLLTIAPAVAAPAPADESSVTAVLRSINPALPLQRARAYARSVMADAWRTHLDPKFIMSIVTVESAWRANAVSRVGARGLGQLMPHTAAQLGVNAWNAADNLRGTSKYLKSLLDRFGRKPNGVKLAIAGYNAGPKAVERFHGVPPYAETQHYVVKVLHVWKQLNARVGTAFTDRPDATIAVRVPLQSPDEQQWLTDVNDVLPATAAVIEALRPVTVTAPDTTPDVTPQPNPAK